jgi:ATP-dependent protease HslVU (ClpYQ) peptidase subunit
MTVIAYRSGIMASDSCWTYGSTQTVSHIKIKRLKSGALLGSAGDNDSRTLEALLDNVKAAEKLPSRAQLAECKVDFLGLLALPRGGVWVVATGKHDDAGYPADDEEDYGVWPATTMGGFAAVGSGGDHALAAMHAHASVTAERAVEIACKMNINCRLPVHKVRLWEANRPGQRPRKSK